MLPSILRKALDHTDFLLNAPWVDILRRFPIKRVLVPLSTPDVPLSFTTTQVERMEDVELLDNFTKVTGNSYLACKHCHYDKVKLTSFVIVIRKWCLKKSNGGLNKNMSVPKTCDHQSLANKRRQPIYTKIYNAPSKEIADTIKEDNKHVLIAPGRRAKIRWQ